MRNIKLVLEYNGTCYCGFQKQPELPTIQGELEKALFVLLKENTTVSYAARTDAGVHATGQVVNFRTASKISLHELQQSINGIMPRDIVAKSVTEVDESFDARYSALSREYKYYVLNRPYRSSFFDSFSYFVAMPLAVSDMREASKHLIGEHDFSSFSQAGDVGNCRRNVFQFEISRRRLPVEGLIVFSVRANSFLTHMVRIMVGTLLEVGLSRLDTADIKRILEGKDRTKSGPTAPAKGLFLTDVCYDKQAK